MGVVNVCCRSKSNSCQRFRLNDVEMEAPVATLRTAVAKHVNSSSDEIEILYAGQKLRDDELLSSYGINNGVTVHVLDKMSKLRNNDENVINKTVSVGSVKGIVSSPYYKTVVEKIISGAESLEKLFNVAPELEKDRVALSILQEPDLLENLVEQRLIDKLIARHPGIGKALVYISKAVSEKSTDMPYQNQRIQYSLDQMSDDEDMDSSSAQGTPQPITAVQLGAALASLGGNTGASSSSGATVSQPQGITTDLFRQAMAAATSESSQPNPVSERDLQQMREMGITDEMAARQALEATGGNIQAALGLLFEDGN